MIYVAVFIWHWRDVRQGMLWARLARYSGPYPVEIAADWAAGHFTLKRIGSPRARAQRPPWTWTVGD